MTQALLAPPPVVRRPAVPVPVPEPSPTPAAVKPGRLQGVDATRGIALLGMVAVHSLYDADASGRPSLSFAIFGGRAGAARTRLTPHPAPGPEGA